MTTNKMQELETLRVEANLLNAKVKIMKNQRLLDMLDYLEAHPHQEFSHYQLAQIVGLRPEDIIQFRQRKILTPAPYAEDPDHYQLKVSLQISENTKVSREMTVKIIFVTKTLHYKAVEEGNYPDIEKTILEEMWELVETNTIKKGEALIFDRRFAFMKK